MLSINKNVKRTIASLMCLSLLVTPYSIKANDKESFNEDNSVIVNLLTEEQINSIHKENLEKLDQEIEMLNNTRDSIIYKRVYVGRGTTGFVGSHEAFNQPKTGSCIAPGGGYYWQDSSTTTGQFSASLSIGGSIVAVSLAYQPGMASGASGGIYTPVGSQYKGCKTKLYSEREFSVEYYDLYKKGSYEPDSAWRKYDTYVSQTPISVRLRASAVSGSNACG